MSADIIFLVESVDRYGRPYTLSDRLKSISPEWIEHFNCEIINTYMTVIGKKIQFQAYNTVSNFDPNKKYYYFITLDHWNYDFSIYFQMLGHAKLKRLHDNNIPLFFAHDLETIPHSEYSFFVKQLEWLYLMRGVYSPVQNEMIFCTASGLVPSQYNHIKNYFYNQFKFIQSPLLFKFTVNEIYKTIPAGDTIVSFILNTKKDRQFTYLNRGSRFHRLTLIHAMRAYNMMNEGYISHSQNFGYSSEQIHSNTLFALDIKKDIIANGGINKMTLDDYYITDNRPSSLPLWPEEMWRSYYDVIGETCGLYFLQDVLDLTLITEKTVKPLLFMRPFMINGGPYCLQYLHKSGFKTYDMIFDESYDKIENLYDRQKIIIDNIKSYIGKYDQLAIKVKQAFDVCLYNRNHAINLDCEKLLINDLKSI